MCANEEILNTLKQSLPFLEKEFGVQKIGVFGSTVKGNSTFESDVDIFIELVQPIGFKFVSLVEYLEKILNKNVDVITKDGLKNIRVTSVRKRITEEIVYV